MSTENGEKKEERNTIPKMRVKFVRFDPIAFALARRIRPRLTAIILRLNSGRDVPNATTSAPMKIGGISKAAVISKAEDTVNLAATRTTRVPIRILSVVKGLLAFFSELLRERSGIDTGALTAGLLVSL